MGTGDGPPETLAIVHGNVTSGEGVAQEFLSLEGYVEQFRTRCGYTPYPGTLNISLDAESKQRWSQLRQGLDGHIRIDPWSNGSQEFGGATCYAAHLGHDGGGSSCHLIVPDRSTHDEEVIELISPKRLRRSFGLADGMGVSVRIQPVSSPNENYGLGNSSSK